MLREKYEFSEILEGANQFWLKEWKTNCQKCRTVNEDIEYFEEGEG